MSYGLRPTPILKGNAAKRFYREVNDGKISKEQKEFLNDCVSLLNKTKE